MKGYRVKGYRALCFPPSCEALCDDPRQRGDPRVEEREEREQRDRGAGEVGAPAERTGVVPGRVRERGGRTCGEKRGARLGLGNEVGATAMRREARG